MTAFDETVSAIEHWFASPRFAHTTRLYTARQIAAQRGTIPADYPVAREAADGFYERLRELFDRTLFDRLLAEEHEKLLRARNRDVHDDSKQTTLPIAREIAQAYVTHATKPPWYIDLLNLNLNLHDLAAARERIARFLAEFDRDGTRITENLDFEAPLPR